MVHGHDIGFSSLMVPIRVVCRILGSKTIWKFEKLPTHQWILAQTQENVLKIEKAASQRARLFVWFENVELKQNLRRRRLNR